MNIELNVSQEGFPPIMHWIIIYSGHCVCFVCACKNIGANSLIKYWWNWPQCDVQSVRVKLLLMKLHIKKRVQNIKHRFSLHSDYFLPSKGYFTHTISAYRFKELILVVQTEVIFSEMHCKTENSWRITKW
jgi:hypothetical protein